MLSDPQFWVGLGQIALINVVLSADNAIVIALAARSLPAHQQKQAVVYGTGAVIAVRIALTLLAVELLRWPYLKIIGAILLFWIAIKLLVPEQHDDNVESADNLMKAIKTILIADLVMSLDNVISVAAAAKGNVSVLVIGLAISIPLVVFFATLLMKVMEKWPVIITIGAGLLGWVAGEMLVTDSFWVEWINANMAWHHLNFWNLQFSWIQVIGAAFVVLLGKLLGAESRSAAGRAQDL